ncbi:carbohydrate ABC transporter permease [Allostreptomyces psammosilenae]|uniref:Multiple sugar transport system permease protein n=1 Tax=Allostreptomyces psammosilenae TaxID=1892865 RepID=A0A852ZQP6_9ACTN|nr:sugar ABC transporter permease [Allostreptomyces psammosilenae]NYI03184.1 multiple sugar transport system permease protein [Allostreptomyces psammosilenae]
MSERTDARRPVRRPLTLARREGRAGLAFVTPTLVVVLAVVVVPIAWTVLLAFQRTRLVDLRTAGLLGRWTVDNLTAVLASPGFWQALTTTLVYSVAGTAASVALGLVAALALRRPFRGRGLLRSAMLLPYVAPVVAATFVWQVALDPQYGIVNVLGTRLLGWDGPVAFLGSRGDEVGLFGATVTVPTALLTVIAFETWRYFPFAYLFLLARLQAVPRDLEEAATVDGATPLQRLRHILLPQLAPVIALLCLLRLIVTFTKFDDVYLLTGGGAGTEVVAIRVYDALTARYDLGAAAAQSLLLAAVMALVLGVYLRLLAPRLEAED